MELSTNLITWQNAVISGIIYFVTLVIYRLTLHPLARFPGPKLAAITRYYEAYYDVILPGQYTFKIREMHKKYEHRADLPCFRGPIIRISPYEIHIMDPAFYEHLYCHDGRWEKYSWAMLGFNVPEASIGSCDHDVHKARRKPLNPFFSKAKVLSREDVIHRNIKKLCERLSGFAKSQTIVPIGVAISAHNRDVSTEFSVNKSYNHLDAEDFNVGMTQIIQASGGMWRVGKHIPWLVPAMKSLPEFLVKIIADDNTRHCLEYIAHTKELIAAATSRASDDKTQRTIVDEIIDSKLPPAEKLAPRVFGDVATVTAGGFETIANPQRLAIFSVYNNPTILRKLRAELASVPRSSNNEYEWKTLEHLPYLISVLMEALRTSPGVSSRTQRIAPDRELIYKEWRIPAGTPVGMTPFLTYMDETIFPDPTCFNPDRWMDFEFRKSVDKVFTPFGRGTRMCLGYQLAWSELYITTATIVQNFDVQFQGLTEDDFEVVGDNFTRYQKYEGSLYGGKGHQIRRLNIAF